MQTHEAGQTSLWRWCWWWVMAVAVAASATTHLGRLQLFQLRPHVVLLQEMCATANTVTATSFFGLRYGPCTSSVSFDWRMYNDHDFYIDK